MTEIVKVKGIPVDFCGTTRIVPPLSLGALEQLQDRLGAFTGDVADGSQVSTVIDSAFAALRRNYPQITREEVADSIGLENMTDVMAAVMDVAGLKRKSLEAEAAPGEAHPAG